MGDLNFGDHYSSIATLETSDLGTHALATNASGERVLVTLLSEAAATSGSLDEAVSVSNALHESSEGRIGSIQSISDNGDGQTILEWFPPVQGCVGHSMATDGAFSLEAALPVLVQALDIGSSVEEAHLGFSPALVGVASQGPHSGQVVLFGYGLHKLLPAYSPREKGAPFFGNPEFMAPEACSGKDLDQRSDLYALGLMAYTLVTGKAPFKSSRPATTLKRQIYEKPLPLRLVKPGVANIGEFEKVLQKALEKDPGKRYSAFSDFAAAVRELAEASFGGVALGGAISTSQPSEPASEPEEVAVAEEPAVDEPVESEEAPSEVQEEEVAEDTPQEEDDSDVIEIGEEELSTLSMLIDSGALTVNTRVRRAGSDVIERVADLLDDIETTTVVDPAPSGSWDEDSTDEESEDSEEKPALKEDVREAMGEESETQAALPPKQAEELEGWFVDPAASSEVDEEDDLFSPEHTGSNKVLFIIGAVAALVVIGVAFFLNSVGDKRLDELDPVDAVELVQEPVILEYEKEEAQTANEGEAAAEDNEVAEGATPSQSCLQAQKPIFAKCCETCGMKWTGDTCDVGENGPSCIAECVSKEPTPKECGAVAEEESQDNESEEEKEPPAKDEVNRRLQLAEQAVERKDVDAAEELYKSVLALDKVNAKALDGLAGLETVRADIAAAAAAAEAAKIEAKNAAAKAKKEEAAKKKAAAAAAAAAAVEEKKAAAAEKKKAAAAKKGKKAKKAKKPVAKKKKETKPAKKPAEKAKASPEEKKTKAKKWMKQGVGALKAGNAKLALRYFKKAKTLAPEMKLIDKYIKKASQ